MVGKSGEQEDEAAGHIHLQTQESNELKLVLNSLCLIWFRKPCLGNPPTVNIDTPISAYMIKIISHRHGQSPSSR